MIKNNNEFEIKDMFSLTEEENLFLAKRFLVGSIYSGAIVEGINVTYPETDAIVNGVNVPRLNVDEIDKICALRDAWKYTLNNLHLPLNLEFICKINEIAARSDALVPGALRTGRVGISGTKWVPPVPQKEELERDIKKILENGSYTERALNFYLYGCVNQLFWDGNKRTSFICANKILINNGAGLFQINDEHLVNYSVKLSELYDSAFNKRLNEKPLKHFLYENCMRGMESVSQKEKTTESF